MADRTMHGVSQRGSCGPSPPLLTAGGILCRVQPTVEGLLIFGGSVSGGGAPDVSTAGDWRITSSRVQPPVAGGRVQAQQTMATEATKAGPGCGTTLQ